MPLHAIRLPLAARQLFRIVALQKRLLSALADPALNAELVDATWIKAVWKQLPSAWVDKFCRGGQLERVQAIAAASSVARQSLFDEFNRQNKVPATLLAGGDFRDIATLPGFSAQLSASVKDFFEECYDLLGQSSRTMGYPVSGGHSITKRLYSEKFCESGPTQVVCPYCDGGIGTPDLDHYYCKSKFPLLACSPWNLVPICKSCNDVATGKGDRIALTPGPPRSATEWLHPFQSPASVAAQLNLEGDPRKAVPSLRSPNAPEQKRLDNHIWLMDRLDQATPFRSLSKRWTHAAAVRFDVVVREVNKKVRAGRTITSVVQEMLSEHEGSRGQEASALVHAGVCRAILQNRPEYIAEFSNSNPPTLA